MKPFDLKKCMEGAKVCTRDGREYKFGAYNPEANKYHKLIGYADGYPISHQEDGKWAATELDIKSKGDLFMASEKKEGWVNLHRVSDTIATLGVHATLEKANDAVNRTKWPFIATCKIEWEE